MVNWRWAREHRRRLKAKKAAWPHEPDFEEVRGQVLAALRGRDPASLEAFEDIAVRATGLARNVVSDALWLMIDSGDLTHTGLETPRFSIRAEEGEEKDDES